MSVDDPLFAFFEKGRMQYLKFFKGLQGGARKSIRDIFVVVLHKNGRRCRREIYVLVVGGIGHTDYSTIKAIIFQVWYRLRQRPLIPVIFF